ncbi:MAG: tripartite tricarboxylate transporter TctB family protein [Rubrivivax sp.]|nr:tripartite tricarboxylate transporter TctB family protein [Rubrivivax sp.]
MSEAVAGGVLPARADRVWGAMWVVLGAAITVGALRMERLEAQGVQWFAAPGLVPGILGVIIAVGGVFLSLRSLRAPVLADETSATDWRRVALTLLLCLGFAGGLVGHGAPFGLVAGIYLFVHITLLQWPERRAAGQTVRGLLVAAAVAVGGALAVPFLFETLFLVRLP